MGVKYFLNFNLKGIISPPVFSGTFNFRCFFILIPSA
jgi:hypothetical protein